MTIELVVLGSGTPFPTPSAPACSGYLLRSGSSTVWVDTGPGTLSNLLATTDLAAVDAIWISHLHADHTADLVLALYALDDGGLGSGTPVPVLAPAGLRDRIAAFLGKPPVVLDPFLTFHDLRDDDRHVIGGLTLLSRRVDHGDVEAYALRATDADAAVAYTGDSRACPALSAIARDVDLLLAQANHLAPEDGAPPPDADRVHLSADAAGDLAHRAGVRALVITHIAPPTSPAAALDRAARGFDGPIHIATARSVVATGSLGRSRR
ncbi:MBL fold metallo-hydrolase [Millisia brevis]|uniref:MBL fold metallo-hydrolase n=1 Tax=Millisia brevis TaxID=264148 RepID=UPI000829757B|nr:MBL fold metallo-hydrolase [Millisia brevis]